MSGTIRNLLIGFVLSATPAMAAADGIEDPEVYMHIETTVRAITLDGMQRRLDVLRSEAAERSRLRAVDADTRKEIDIVFAQWGVSAGEHAAYGADHADEIERWIDRHPRVERELGDLESRFRALSTKLRNAR